MKTSRCGVFWQSDRTTGCATCRSAGCGANPPAAAACTGIGWRGAAQATRRWSAFWVALLEPDAEPAGFGGEQGALGEFAGVSLHEMGDQGRLLPGSDADEADDARVRAVECDGEVAEVSALFRGRVSGWWTRIPRR